MYLFNRLRAFRQAKVFRKWSVVLCVVGGVLWVVCCVHIVSNLGQKSDRIGPKSVENRFKIDENLVSERRGTILGQWSRQGRTNPEKVIAEIPKIANGTKIDQWRQDRHWDPLKTLSGSGFEKTRKSMKF